MQREVLKLTRVHPGQAACRTMAHHSSMLHLVTMAVKDALTRERLEHKSVMLSDEGSLYLCKKAQFSAKGPPRWSLVVISEVR